MSDDSTHSGPLPDQGKQTLGGYELLAKVGQGTMGAVYKTRQISMNRVVALKVLSQQLAENAEFVARFLREAQAAARVNHTNIVQAFDTGEADGHYYLAMEFVDGPSLDELLTATGALPEQRALEITRDIASGLRAAHGAGLIHRDVKPANILLTSDGTAKLADLGLARECTVDDEGCLTNLGFALGSPDYIAPEQIRAEADIDGRCDIYSLGATLYHLLTGAHPYTGATGTVVMSKHLAEAVPNARQANPQVSVDAATIIMKAMAKNREDRYSDASEMLAAVEAVLRGERPSVAAPPPQRAAPPPQRTAPPPQQAAPAAQQAAPIAHPRHALSRAPRRKSTTGLYVGGAIAAVAVIGLLVALFAGPKNPPPARKRSASARKTSDSPEALAAKADAERLATLREWVRKHPGEYGAAIESYRRAIARMTSPTTRMNAQGDVRELRRKLNAGAQAALASIKRRAAAMAKTGDYDGAIALFNKVPAPFVGVLADAVNRATGQLKAEADTKIRTALSEARKLAANGKHNEAIAKLKQLDGMRYAAGLTRVKSVRAELAAQYAKARGTTERARQQQLLNEVRAVLPAGLRTHRFEALATRLDKLIADPDLDLIKKELEADRKVITKLSALLRRVRANARAEAGKTVKTTIRWKGIGATMQTYDATTDTVHFDRGEQTITEMRATDLKALLDLNPGPANEYHEPLALLFIAEGTPKGAQTHIEQADSQTLIRHLRRVLGGGAGGGAVAVKVVPVKPVKIPTTAQTDDSPTMRKSRALFKEYCGYLETKRTAARAARRQAAETEMQRPKAIIARCKGIIARYASRGISYYRIVRAEKSIATQRQKLAAITDKTKAALKTIDRKAATRKLYLLNVLLGHKKALDLGRTFTDDQLRIGYEKVVPAEPGGGEEY